MENEINGTDRKAKNVGRDELIKIVNELWEDKRRERRKREE